VANVKLRLPIAVLLTAFVAGCGGGDDEPESTPSPATGGGGNAQKTFVDNCGNCHTLAAAGTSGKVGPDLDQLRPGPDLVNTQVTNGGGGMPAFKGKLSPEQISGLANYVADNAGKSQ
jgi:mono/diheme cytochrome c family protein